MALLQWKPEYAIGIEEVDFEHRALIDLINELDAGLQTNASELGAALASLGEIQARIAAHFALEEKVMRELGYSELAGHKAEHERLLDEIADIADDCAQASVVDRDRLAASLDHWFTDHFKTFDARFHQSLARSGRGS